MATKRIGKREIGFGLLAIATGFGLYAWQLQTNRDPASASHANSFTLPENFEGLSASDKEDALWEKITSSEHSTLPPLRDFGAPQLWSMQRQGVRLKVEQATDVAPEGWVKYIHAVGSVAKIAYVPAEGSPYSGIFQGSERGLIRLSLTYDPSRRGVAPGVALKFLVSGQPSVNVSALPSLQPQGQNYDFFAHSLSNIVPAWSNVGARLVHWVFSSVSAYPESLSLENLSKRNSEGVAVAQAKSPRQIFLVPADDMHFAQEPHDIRDDLSSIEPGRVLYHVRAVDESHRDFDYADYTDTEKASFLEGSHVIGDLVLRSKFVASEFGDVGLFFPHQRVDR